MLDCVRMSPWVSTCNPRPPAGEARVALGVDEAAFEITAGVLFVH